MDMDKHRVGRHAGERKQREHQKVTKTVNGPGQGEEVGNCQETEGDNLGRSFLFTAPYFRHLDRSENVKRDVHLKGEQHTGWILKNMW